LGLIDSAAPGANGTTVSRIFFEGLGSTQCFCCFCLNSGAWADQSSTSRFGDSFIDFERVGIRATGRFSQLKKLRGQRRPLEKGWMCRGRRRRPYQLFSMLHNGKTRSANGLPCTMRGTNIAAVWNRQSRPASASSGSTLGVDSGIHGEPRRFREAPPWRNRRHVLAVIGVWPIRSGPIAERRASSPGHRASLFRFSGRHRRRSSPPVVLQGPTPQVRPRRRIDPHALAEFSPRGKWRGSIRVDRSRNQKDELSRRQRFAVARP